MNTAPPLEARLAHARRPAFAREDKDANGNRPQHDDQDGDNRALNELVTWLGSLAAHNVADIDDAEDEESAENETSPGETTRPVDGKQQKKRSRRGKTPFQQEYNRISQRERRQEKRKQKRREKRAEQGLEDDDENTNEFPLLWVIYLAHERDGQLRKEFPKSVQKSMDGTKQKETVEDYMRNYDAGQGLECLSAKELEDYLVIKRRELIGLRRRLMAIGRTEEFYKKKLQAVDVKLGGLMEKSPEWLRIRNEERFQVVHKLAVVGHAATVLPLLIEQAGKRFQDLISTVNKGYGIKVLFEEAESLRSQLSDEKKKVDVLEQRIKHVVPFSEAYNETLGALHKAERRKKDLEEQMRTVEGDLFKEAESLRRQLTEEKKTVRLLEKRVKKAVPTSDTYNEMVGKLRNAKERKEDLRKQIGKVEEYLEAASPAKE